MTDNVVLAVHPRGFYKTPAILFFQLLFIAAISLISAYVILPNFSPMHQGYICDDPNLKYKFRPNTIEIAIVHLTGYLLLLITIFLIECQPFYGVTSGLKSNQNEETSLNDRLTHASYAFFASQLGLFMNFLLYNLVKYSCGRLRPHFLDVCRPSTMDCVPGSYVDSYFCTGHDNKLNRDAHLSFYSGHAATAFYYATFLTVYMQMRLRKKLLHCLPFVYVINVLLFAAASFVALSRISDNKHHNSDVVFGSLIGIIIGASVVFIYLREVFKRIRIKPYIAPESILTLDRRHFPQAPQINETSASRVQ